ncbi:MAG: glycosyltransferase [Endomicrobiales bacterium]
MEQRSRAPERRESLRQNKRNAFAGQRENSGARALDVLIPTFRRPAALGITLSTLASQEFRDFRVVISDQSDTPEAEGSGEVAAIVRFLRFKGIPVELHHHLPRRGMAEQRQFLLERARAPYCLFLDDDLLLEPDVVGRMYRAMREEDCGFVGCGLIGLSFLEDVRPREQAVEFWDGPVRPEKIAPGSKEWERYKLHNAANLYHLQRRLKVAPASPRKYRVAWVGGCVLYDTAKLRAAGGFAFWEALPPAHCGEDVLAQLRVMSRYGGCGILPSGVYHQELPTTLPDRSVAAPRVLMREAPGAG